MFCVMQDDGLITDLRVKTDRLLTSDGQHDIVALVRVTILGSRLTWGNMDLLST
jgi:hypothetical protein